MKSRHISLYVGVGIFLASAAAICAADSGRPSAGSSGTAPNWMPIASQPQQSVHAVTDIRLIERGALLVDDFEADHIDSQSWRVWQEDPQATAVGLGNGRLELSARGQVGHNGLLSHPAVKYKDVVLVGEMDIRSQGAEPHHLALHLCGGDAERSPDHWTEVVLTDLGVKARFSTLTARPEVSDHHQDQQTLVLPHPPGQGFLCRVELSGETNLAQLSVKTAEGWKPVADPIDLNLRTVHTEIKINGCDPVSGAAPSPTVSQAWFDNVRIYPCPQSHFVGFRLVTPNGDPIWRRPNNGWPPIFMDPSGKVRPISDLTVQLLTSDGSRVVASVQSNHMGFYVLPLKDAPWDVYPVAAQIRVLLDGAPLGKPLVVGRPHERATEGIYPDDVYNLIME